MTAQTRDSEAGHRRSARRAPRTAWIALAGALAALLAPAGASAATKPDVTTGAAKSVSYASATLTGHVNPEGDATSFYFQYGPTRAYGGQSTIAGTGAVTKSIPVGLAIEGLQPLTVYHYRLVGVSAAGTSFGADQTFRTLKVPLSLAIVVTPDPVLFGGAATIQGTLSGTNNAGRTVVLQGNPFPYTAGFQNIGNPELTSAQGAFSFTLIDAMVNAEFRVVTTTNPPVVSPVVSEPVAVRVSSHLARTHRRGFARVYGTVTPAVNGAQVGVLRTVHGRGVLAGGTVLRPRNASSSRFSVVVRVHSGVYRVLVRLVGAAQVSNYGQPLLVR